VDVLEEEAAFAMLDYRLHGSGLKLDHVRHGLTLQLLVNLLALRSHSHIFSGATLAPAGAFYVRLLRQLESVEHPSEAPEPDDPKFPLRGKQRGIFDGQFGQCIDRQWSQGDSDVVSGYITKDGTFGRKRSTDVAEAGELAALLDMVRQLLGQLGDQIIDGQIDVRPYRMNRETPCSMCTYRAVCRFDAAINRYRILDKMDRESVLRQALEGVNDEQ
jgi:ATP-dependent helicase/nuclease subunit B